MRVVDSGFHSVPRGCPTTGVRQGPRLTGARNFSRQTTRHFLTRQIKGNYTSRHLGQVTPVTVTSLGCDTLEGFLEEAVGLAVGPGPRTGLGRRVGAGRVCGPEGTAGSEVGGSVCCEDSVWTSFPEGEGSGWN